MDLGSPGVGDFCDPENIREVVDARSSDLQHCYERQLQTNPDLSGHVTANWRIELDGSVSNATIAESTLNHRQAEGCMVRQLEQMRFDEPDGGMCDIDFPFVFSGLE